MILTVVLSILLVAVAAADDDYYRGGPLRAAGRMNERVQALEDGAANAKAKVQKAVVRARAVGAKVLRMEDDSCGSGREFQCGGYERRCISDLLVCDGHSDCTDGQDEDADLCRTRTPVGAVFVGDIARRNQGGCGADIRQVRVSIVWSQRLSWFQSRQKVKAAVSLTGADGSDIGAVVRGYYSFRQRALVLLPMDDVPAKLAITCEFDGVQDDRCLASARYSDLSPCVQFGMKREA